MVVECQSGDRTQSPPSTFDLSPWVLETEDWCGGSTLTRGRGSEGSGFRDQVLTTTTPIGSRGDYRAGVEEGRRHAEEVRSGVSAGHTSILRLPPLLLGRQSLSLRLAADDSPVGGRGPGGPIVPEARGKGLGVSTGPETETG